MNEVSNQHHRTFEQIRQRTQEGGEFWSARDLMPILEYSRWDKFKAGVETRLDFAIFQNHGYRGLYGGLDAGGIQRRKGLGKGQHILDHMGSTELAANLFRATQTEDKLRRENIKGKQKANQTHREVGAKVRRTIKELGGAMPENLPTPKTSVKLLENKNQYRVSETVRVWG